MKPASNGNRNVFQFVTQSPVSRLDYFYSVPRVHHLGKHADSTKHLIASLDFICKLESRGSVRKKKTQDLIGQYFRIAKEKTMQLSSFWS